VRRLCCLTLADPRAVALSGEPVQVGATVVAQVTSGNSAGGRHPHLDRALEHPPRPYVWIKTAEQSSTLRHILVEGHYGTALSPWLDTMSRVMLTP